MSELEKKLESVIEHLTNIGTTAYDMSHSPPDQLNNQMNEYIAKLQELDKCKDKETCHIPKEILQFVSDGKDPDLYSMRMTQNLIDKSQKSVGRETVFKVIFDCCRL